MLYLQREQCNCTVSRHTDPDSNCSKKYCQTPLSSILYNELQTLFRHLFMGIGRNFERGLYHFVSVAIVCYVVMHGQEAFDTFSFVARFLLEISTPITPHEAYKWHNFFALVFHFYEHVIKTCTYFSTSLSLIVANNVIV